MIKGFKFLTNNNCKHDWRVIKTSNVIVYTESNKMRPSRLIMVECKKCNKTTPMWIDTILREGDIEVKWEDLRSVLSAENL